MSPRIGILAGVAVLAVCASGISTASDVGSTVRDADACVAAHKFDCAQALYERAQSEGMRFDTDLPHARNLATAYLNSTPPDLAKAINWLQVAVRLDPQSDSLRAQLAGTLVRAGNLDAATELYRNLAESHPTSTEYGIQLATVLRQAGKSDAALQFLQASTEKYPSLVAFRIEYARLLNFTKQYPEARKQFLAALAIEPQNLIAQVGLAKATSYEGDQETAIVMYDRILQRHPGSYDAIVGKAFSLLWSGQTAQAGELLRRASVRNPDDPEVREALSTLPHSADSSAALPEERNRRLDTRRRAPNSQAVESKPAPLLARTTASRTEHLLPQPEQPHRYGVAAALIGFCLMLAPFLYGRPRSRQFESRLVETGSFSSEPIPEFPLSNSEGDSGEFFIPLEARQASSVDDSSANTAPLASSPAEDATRNIEHQEVHGHSHPIAPDPGDFSHDKVSAVPADYPPASYEPVAEAQESEAKAQLKILLNLATSFDSLVKGNSTLSADSSWGAPEDVGDAMCFGLTSPLQGSGHAGQAQGNSPQR